MKALVAFGLILLPVLLPTLMEAQPTSRSELSLGPYGTFIGGEQKGAEAGIGLQLASFGQFGHDDDVHVGMVTTTLGAEWRAERGSISLRGSIWASCFATLGFSVAVSSDDPRRTANFFGEYGVGISGFRAYWRIPYHTDPLTPDNEFVLSLFVPLLDLKNRE